MFENKQPTAPDGAGQAPTPPAPPTPQPSVPGEVVDIFEGINTGGGVPSQPVAPQMPVAAPSGSKKGILIAVIVVIVILVIAGGVLANLTFMQPEATPIIDETQPPVSNVNTTQPTNTVANVNTDGLFDIDNTNTVDTNMNTNEVIDGNLNTNDTNTNGVDTNTNTNTTNTNTAPALDSDADGLSDLEEADLGTDPLKGDTDDDGLFDREEVRIWFTNPLNPDTDGDTYLDGDEVDNGYNPNGPGLITEALTNGSN